MEFEAKLRAALADAGQSQLLRFESELNEEQQKKLAGQLRDIDWEQLPKWVAEYVLRRPETAIPSDLSPTPYFPLEPRDAAEKAYYAEAEKRGRELIAAGKVCCLTVAGGQGTRLGFDGPKGTFPIGPLTGRPLFAYFAEGILRTQEKYGARLDWYIMTSVMNRSATEEFFRTEHFFGLDPEQVFFFTQGTMPAIGSDGKLLLSAKDSLALSPDGHGGTLLALRKSGALDRMARAGVEAISYFQVDNPLVPVADPLFLGLHALEKSEMSAIMLAKTGPHEKLGNLCVSEGHLQIIEYSDLPAELAEQRDAAGKLRFIAGSPAIHVISRAFVERLTAGGTLRLPFHRADKKIPCLDAAGNPVKPESPNGVKLETFIFDALSLASKTMVLEGARSELFAPVKNASGVDSVESCRAMLTARDLRRLTAAGVEIGSGAEVEISPRRIVDDADAVEYVRARGIEKLAPGSRTVMD